MDVSFTDAVHGYEAEKKRTTLALAFSENDTTKYVGKIQELQEENAHLKRELSEKLRARDEAYTSLSKEHEQQLAALTEAKDKISTLEATVEEMTSKESGMVQLAVAPYISEVENLKKALFEAELEVSRISSWKTERQNLMDQIEALQSRLDTDTGRLNTELSNMEYKLAMERNSIRDAIAETLEAEKAALIKAAHEAVDADIQRMIEEHAHMKQELSFQSKQVDLLLEHNSQLEMKLTDYKNRLALEEEQKQILISRFYYMRQKWGRSRNRFQSPSSAATPSFRADIDGLDSASSPVTPTSPTFHFPGRRYIPAGAGNAAANNAEAKRFVPEPISRQPYLNLQQQQNGKAAPGFLATRPAVPTSMGAHADTTYHIASGSGSSSVVSVRDEKRAKQSRVADMKALHIVDSATASLKHAFPAVVHPQGDKPRSRSNVRVSTGASVDRESALSTPTTAGSHDRKAASFALQTHSPGAESDGVSRSSPAQSRDRSRSSSFSRGVADKGERSDNTASVQDGVRIGNLVFAPSFLVGEQDDEDSFGRHSLGVSNALHRRTPVKEEEDDHSDPELYSALHSESRGGSGAHSRARFLGSPAFTTPQHKGGGAMSKRGDGMICASCRQPQGLKSPGLSKKTVETAQRNVLHALEVRNEAWTSLGSLAKDFMQLLAAIPETRPSTTNSASIPTLTAASATSMALSSLESAARKLVDTVRPIPGTAEHKLKGSPQAKGGAVDTSPSSSILANPVVAQATLALVRSLRTMVLLLMSEETKAVGVEEHRFLMALLQELQSNYLTSASSSPQSKKLSRDGPKGTKKERVGIRLQTIGSDGEDDVTADFQPTKKTDIDTDARESETMSNKHEEQGDNNSPELEDDTIQDAFLDLTSDLFPDTMSLSHAYLTLLRMETLQSARNKTTTCRDCAIKAAVSAASRSPSPASRGMLEAPGSSTSAKMPISARFFTELSHGLGRSPTRNNFQKPLPSPPNAMSPLTTKFLTYTPPPASKKAAFFEGDDEPVAKGGLAKSAFVSAKQVRTTIATENVSPRNTPGKAATLNTVPSNNHSTITVPSIRQSHAAFMSGR